MPIKVIESPPSLKIESEMFDYFIVQSIKEVPYLWSLGILSTFVQHN